MDRTLGAYRLSDELGRGAGGVVFKAFARDGETVAIKLLTCVAPDALERFSRELRIQASLLAEGGFVPVLDAGNSPHGPYLVMPYLGGGSLRRHLRGKWPWVDVLELGVKLAEALGRAHEAGVVHRDLKPDNVLFDAGGVPLIADLGLAKHWAGDRRELGVSRSLSTSGEMRGTAGYMAPEQMADAKRVTPAADVFSLGVVLYEAATGEAPFTGLTLIEVLARVAQGQAESIRRRRPDFPAAAADVIQRCLAKAPEERYPDGAALAAALRTAELAVQATGSSRARGAGVLLAAVGLALLGALFLWGAFTPDSESEGLPAVADVRSARQVAGSEVRPEAPPAVPDPPDPQPARVPEVDPEPLEGVARDLAHSLTLEPMARFGDGHLKSATSVAWLGLSGNGRMAATLDMLGWIRTYRTRDGEALIIQRVSRGPTRVFALHPGGAHILLGSRQRTVVRSLGTGSDMLTIPNAGGARRAAWDVRDGSLALLVRDELLFATGPGLVRVRRARLPAGATGSWLAVASERILVDGANGQVHWFGIDLEGNLVHQGVVDEDAAPVSSLALDESGAWAAVARKNGRLRALPLGEEGAVVLDDAERGARFGLAFLPGLQLQAVDARSVRRWSVETSKEVYRLDLVQPCTGAVSDGRTAVLRDEHSQRVRLVDLNARREPALGPGHADWVTHVAGGQAGLVISSGADARLIARRGQEVRWALDLPKRASGLALDPTGRRLVVAGPQGVGRILDAERGTSLGHLRDAKQHAHSVRFLSDGRLLVGDAAGHLFWRDLDSGTTLRQAQVHPRGPVQALFQIDGGVISCAPLEVVRWSEQGERRTRVPPARPQAVLPLAQGARLLVGGMDGSLTLLNGQGAVLARAQAAHTAGSVIALGAHPDGERVLSSGYDSMLRVWSVVGDRLSPIESLKLERTRDLVVSFNSLPDGTVVAGTARGVQVRCRWR